MNVRRGTVSGRPSLFRDRLPQLALWVLVVANFFVWLLVAYEHVEQNTLEYVIQKQVKTKIGLLRREGHLRARVYEAESLRRVQSRLRRDGVELVAPKDPPLVVGVGG